MNITKEILSQIGFEEDGTDLKSRQIYSLKQSHHAKISLIEDTDGWLLFIMNRIEEQRHTTFASLFFSLYLWGYEDGKNDKKREIWKVLGLE